MEDLGIRLSAEGFPEFVDASGRVVAGTRQMGAEADKAGAALGRQAQQMREQRAAANLLAQAQRQLPMQATDIVTSLASGMPVWMVAIQQGGQLRDSYGGILPAGRALLGLLTPTALALGGTAAAAAALGAAYFRAQNEVVAFANAVTLSGNAAGVTLAQLDSAARNVGSRVGTQTGAAEVMAQLVSGARVAAPQIERVGEAVVQMTRNLGFSQEQAVELFSRLGKEPATAIAALNERYNFLTIDVFRQIQALEQQGRTAEAAALAQETMAAAMIERGQEVETRVWGIEAAWRAVTDEVKRAGDAMVQGFRPETLQDRVREASNRALSAAQPGGGLLQRWLYGTQEEAQANLRNVLRDGLRTMEIEQQNADGRAAAAAQARQAIAEAQKKTQTPTAPPADPYRGINDDITRRLMLAGQEIALERELTQVEQVRVQVLAQIEAAEQKGNQAGAEAARGRLQALTVLLEMQAQARQEQAATAAAQDAVFRQRQAEWQAGERAVQQLEREVAALELSTEEIGLNAEALYALQQARLATELAGKRALLTELEAADTWTVRGDQLRDEIRLLETKQRLLGRRFQAEQDVEEEREAKRRTDRFAESIEQGILEGYRNGRSLTDVFLAELKAQFAKTVLRPVIQPIAAAGSDLLSMVLQGLGGMFGGGVPIAPEFQTGLPLPGFDMPGAGYAKGTNYVPRDMVTLIHEGEAVVPKSFNPWAGGKGIGGGRGTSITLAPRISIDARTDSAQVYGLTMQAMAATKAELVEMMQRGEV